MLHAQPVIASVAQASLCFINLQGPRLPRRPIAAAAVMPATTPDATMAQFTDLVNMGAEELEAWLATPESGSVGITHEGESESQGVKRCGQPGTHLATRGCPLPSKLPCPCWVPAAAAKS